MGGAKCGRHFRLPRRQLPASTVSVAVIVNRATVSTRLRPVEPATRRSRVATCPQYRRGYDPSAQQGGECMKGHLICVRELHRARDGPARTCSPHPRLPYVNATEPDAVAEPYSATVKRTKPARFQPIPAGANAPGRSCRPVGRRFRQLETDRRSFYKPHRVLAPPRRGRGAPKREARRWLRSTVIIYPRAANCRC